MARSAHDGSRPLATLIELSSDAILTINRDRLITRFNGAAEQLYGWRAADLLGKPARMLVNDDDHVTQAAFVDRVFVAHGRADPGHHRASGSRRAAAAHGRSRPLTGLLNRRGFDRELKAHLTRSQRYGTTGALLMFDLDNFKLHNDTHGHGAGDELLVALADGLRRRLRPATSPGAWEAMSSRRSCPTPIRHGPGSSASCHWTTSATSPAPSLAAPTRTRARERPTILRSAGGDRQHRHRLPRATVGADLRGGAASCRSGAL